MFGQSSQLLKVTVLVLFIVALGGIAYVILAQRGLVGDQSSDRGLPVIPKDPKEINTSSSPAVPAILPPTISMEDAQKQFRDIQDQVNAGTLSLEEAKRQMDMISARVAPPELPAEAKKQIEEEKETQQ